MQLRALHRFVPDPDGFRADPPAEPVVWQRPVEPLVALLGLEDVDELLDSRPLNRNMVSVVSSGTRTPAAAYTWSGRPIQPGFADVVRQNRIGSALRDGATVVLESLHRTWRPIAEVCRRLSYEVGVPVSANAYLTPPDTQGFAHHYDTHGVLIVQTAGSKTWQLHRPIFSDPLEHQPFRSDAVPADTWHQLRTGTPFLETTLRPGDLLWIPRGWIHNGFATDEASLHVSLSFASVSRFWIAQELVKRLDQDPELRHELPWGFARDAGERAAAIETVIKIMGEALRTPVPDTLESELADSYSQFFLEAARPAVSGTLTPPPAADQPCVIVAEAVIRRSWQSDGQLRLHLADGLLTLPQPVGAVVDALLEADSENPFTSGDLDGLADSDATELISVLFRWGIVRFANGMSDHG